VSLWNFVWTSAYHDSVTLMRLTRDLEAVAGVERAAAMMGTPANRDLLREAGLLTPEGDAAAPTDLVIAVQAADETAARAGEAAARKALAASTAAGARGAADGGGPQRTRTLRGAVRARPDATLALISVPGMYAGAEARRALDAGLHVMLFSDNVPVETEVALKRHARARGLVLMGPDCGTAIVGGVPLGFANAVPPGRIGIAAASGTGLQEVACLVARAGEGISHAIGVGGRDLSDAVGGLGMEQALEMLAADAATDVICVVAKPPGPAVAARLRKILDGLGKPWVAHLVGQRRRAGHPGDPGSPESLEDCARIAVALARGERDSPWPFAASAADVERTVAAAVAFLASGQRFVRGVYSGGTLAWEALDVLAGALPDVVPGVTGGDRAGHGVVDLGEDVFTVGRPHPMLDGTVRRDWIVREARDPATAVLLLDLVLGHGAHPDPAGELVPALETARSRARAGGRGLAIVASVTGTDADPQNRSLQVARLQAAGVAVMPSNAQAARLAASIAERAARR
jgi:succinyl-CoA synthetase alpha subunit